MALTSEHPPACTLPLLLAVCCVSGEFGSRFEDPEDLAHLRDLASYLNAQGSGNTGAHKPVNNWFYWCYNANSGELASKADPLHSC